MSNDWMYFLPALTSQKSTSENTIPDWLTNASRVGINAANTLINTPAQAYSGQIAPGLSDNQKKAGQLINNTIGNYQKYFDQGVSGVQGSMKQAPDITAQTYKNGLANIDSYMTPYMNEVVNSVQDLNKQSLDQALTQTGDQAIGAKAFGSSRHGVQEGVATANNNLNLTNVIANLKNTGWNQATALLGQDITNNFNAQAANQANANNYYNRMLTGGQAIANIGTANRAADVADINNLLQYGNLEQQTQAAQNQAAYQEWLRQQNIPYQNLQAYTQAVAAAPHSTTSNTSTSGISYSPQQSTTGGNPLMGGLGGAATGAYIGSIIPGIGTAAGAGIGGLLGAAGAKFA